MIKAIIEVVEGVQDKDILGWLPRETREVPYNMLAGFPGELLILDGRVYTVVSIKYV